MWGAGTISDAVKCRRDCAYEFFTLCIMYTYIRCSKEEDCERSGHQENRVFIITQVGQCQPVWRETKLRNTKASRSL